MLLDRDSEILLKKKQERLALPDIRIYYEVKVVIIRKCGVGTQINKQINKINQRAQKQIHKDWNFDI